MKNISKYIFEKLTINKDTEVNDKYDISPEELKKMIKSNGFKVPSTFTFDEKRKGLIYTSTRGHRGDKVLNDIKDKLLLAKWKSLKEFDKDKSSPTGSSIEYLSTYISPDKNIVFHTSRYFGSTSDDNRYKGVFETLDNFEIDLTLEKTKEEIVPLLKKIKVNLCKDDFINYYTYKHRLYFGLEKIENALGKSDDNTWKDDGFIITCKPGNEYNSFYNLIITKEKPEKVKIKLD